MMETKLLPLSKFKCDAKNNVNGGEIDKKFRLCCFADPAFV